LLDRIDSLRSVLEQATDAIEYLIERANDSDECAAVCEKIKSNWNYCAAAIRALKGK
jgi:hypothetical protein